MGTDVSVSVVTQTEVLGKQIADEAFAVISDYEQKFSRFIPTSELSSLNASSSSVVSDEFFAVLKCSRELYRETQGAFNPLVQITRHGYSVDYAEIDESMREQNTDTYNTNFNSVVTDAKTKTVTLQSNQRLDFNGMLKGYLATKLAHELKEKYPDCQGLIINIGGDLHTIGLDEDGKVFVFKLYNPITKTETPIHLTNTALVTSGIYHRMWQTKTGEKHHILDATGMKNPTSDIVSASVIYKDGAVAEAYATLFVVKGFEEAKTIIDTTSCTYWLVQSDGEVLTNIL